MDSTIISFRVESGSAGGRVHVLSSAAGRSVLSDQARSAVLSLSDEATTERAALVPADVLDCASMGPAERAATHDASTSGRTLLRLEPRLRLQSMTSPCPIDTQGYSLDVSDASHVWLESTTGSCDLTHLRVRRHLIAYGVDELEPPPGNTGGDLAAPDPELWTRELEKDGPWLTGTSEPLCPCVVQRPDVAGGKDPASGNEPERSPSTPQALLGAPQPVVLSAYGQGQA